MDPTCPHYKVVILQLHVQDMHVHLPLMTCSPAINKQTTLIIIKEATKTAATLPILITTRTRLSGKTVELEPVVKIYRTLLNCSTTL